MMKKIIAAAIAAIVLVALISCGTEAPVTEGYAPNQMVEAYAYSHGGYVGQAVITTDAEGMIDVSINEAFLPHTLAVVDLEADEWTEDNTVYYLQRGSEVRVAKFVEYAGTVYVGTTVGSALAYVEADEEGNPAGGTILEKAILRNQSTMAAYYANIAAGEFKTFTEFGGRRHCGNHHQLRRSVQEGLRVLELRSSAGPAISKPSRPSPKKTAPPSPSTTWFARLKTAKACSKWAVADVVTGATASDFKDYFGLVLLAAAQLK
jgi:hypothetical protein